ncbi:MAG: nucleotide exchange factor GrpE [Phycisphaerales bacterium]
MSKTDEHNETHDERVDPEIIDEHASAEDEATGEPTLENQLADLEDKYRRALADYQNFQRRAIENEQRAREQGATDILRSLIPVLDHCQLALTMNAETSSTEQVLAGVKGIVDQFLASLERHGLAPIKPEAGEEFDPGRHEAMLRVASDEVEPGHIVQVLQMGYELRGRVVRPAQVSVRPAEDEG